jgi:hypothetical protein
MVWVAIRFREGIRVLPVVQQRNAAGARTAQDTTLWITSEGGRSQSQAMTTSHVPEAQILRGRDDRDPYQSWGHATGPARCPWRRDAPPAALQLVPHRAGRLQTKCG